MHDDGNDRARRADDGAPPPSPAWRAQRINAMTPFVSDIIALLGGSHYMDPPDGGDVSLLEQLRRMAEAAKWRKSEGSR